MTAEHTFYIYDVNTGLITGKINTSLRDLVATLPMPEHSTYIEDTVGVVNPVRVSGGILEAA